MPDPITAIIAATTAIDAVTALVTALAQAVPSIIAACSVLAAFLPPPEGDGVWANVHKFINKMAFNFKNAENKS